MSDQNQHHYPKLLLSLFLAISSLWVMQSFIPSIVWAIILAIGTWPLYTRVLQKFPNRVGLVAGGFTLMIVSVVIVPLGFLSYQFSKDIHALTPMLNDIRDNGFGMPDWLNHLPFNLSPIVENWWKENFFDVDSMKNTIMKLHLEISSIGKDVGLSVLHHSVRFIFTAVTLFFLYHDGEYLSEQLLYASQKSFGNHGEVMVRQFTKSLHGVIDGLVLVGFAEGFVMGVAFAITGVPNATILGALTIIAGMIPLGATLIFTGGALFLCQQDHLMMAFGLMVCGLLTTTIVDHIVRPILIGNATKLHFILVLFGVLGGFETMGLLGLFIGPTIMSAVVFLWRNWLESPVIPQE